MECSKNNRVSGFRLWGGLILIVCVGLTMSVGVWAQSSSSTVCFSPLPPDGEPPCGQASGNPINVTSGNKFQREVDMPALPGVLGLELVRNYNSASSKLSDAPSMMGKGWRLSYDWTLRFDHAGGNEQIILVQGDGTQEVLVKHRETDSSQRRQWTGKWRALGAMGGELAELRAQSRSQYVWTEPSGKRYRFDERGQSIAIEMPTGEFLTIEREKNGDIAKVTDPQGRTLRMHLLDDQSALRFKKFGGIQAVDTPIGRYQYDYGGSLPTGSTVDPMHLLTRLVSVSHAGIVRQYLFEDAKQATLLTGIRVIGQGSDGAQINLRIATWAYDEKGRAVLSMRGDAPNLGRPVMANTTLNPSQGAEELIRLKFLPPRKTADGQELGSTILSNSLGQNTSYQYRYFAGKPKLTEVLGPGCAACGANNIRHEYDPKGRLLETVHLAPAQNIGAKTIAGEPLQATRWAYDQKGRPIQKLRVAFVSGKAQAPTSLLRFEYTDTGGVDKLSMIARPSVVPGQEHRIKLSYNEFGQVTEVVQTGFEPIYSKPLLRTMRYRYQTIQGRSVLLEIDGPLPNGQNASPEDSDIQRFMWDAQGNYLAQITEPGGFVHKRLVDSIGRLSERYIDDGFRRTQDQYQYTKDGRLALSLESLQRTAWALSQEDIAPSSKLSLEIQTLGYDALGRLSRETDSAGRPVHRIYDLANRVKSVSDSKGHRSVNDFDTEGRLLRSGLYRPEQGEPLRATYFWHDSVGRIIERLLPDGRLDSWQYGSQGTLAEHIDGDGIRKLFMKSKDQVASAVVSMAPDGELRAQISSPKNLTSLRDDFGRVVQVHLPDHGKKQYKYDETSNSTQALHVDGSSVVYAFDHRGRLRSKAYLDSNQKRQSEVRLNYQGLVLKESVDDEQVTVFQYDSLGRLIEERIRMQGLKKEFITQHHYDQNTGLLKARKLFDGQTMHLARSSALDGATIQALSLQPPWAIGLEKKLEYFLPTSAQSAISKRLPKTILASEIEIDPFNGLSSYTAGNGLKTQREFDRAGRLITLDTQGINTLRYQYQTGPRVRRIVEEPKATPSKESPLKETNFDYTGFGALINQAFTTTSSFTKIAATGADLSSLAAQKPLAPKAKFDLQGRTTEDDQFAYQYSLRGQVSEIADRKTGVSLASYRYNSLGQRVSKSIPGGKTTFFLWQDNRIVAEVNQNGDIESQYIYFDEGHQNTTARATPIAKIESASNKGNPSNGVRVLYIHNDHRGAPIAMSDKSKAVVWEADATDSAWGRRIDVRNVSDDITSKTFSPATLNLRMPGQYFDSETGLHDNFHRTYNPASGRYLQPDPLGYPDGPDAYSYASGDPVNKVDPLGLYEIDVHYYMTYFLSRTAGIGAQQAYTIALGAQYIDDNPDTWPLDEQSPLSNLLNPAATQRLAKYHFTQAGLDSPPLPSEVSSVSGAWVGGPLGLEWVAGKVNYAQSYIDRRFENPLARNTQLANLKNAADIAPNICARAQFMGEFIHAFQDSFGHRDRLNEPIPIAGNQGHLVYGHEPDKTYNAVVTVAEKPIFFNSIGDWNQREARTLQMEREVHEQLKSFATKNGKTGKTIAFATIEQFLVRWNKTKDNAEKILLLDEKLAEFGFGPLPAYDRICAEAKRKEYIGRGLVSDPDRWFGKTFPGTILPADRGKAGSAKEVCGA